MKNDASTTVNMQEHRLDVKNRPMCLSGKGVTKYFGFGKKLTKAVDHVDFEFHEGELVSICLLYTSARRSHRSTSRR